MRWFALGFNIGSATIPLAFASLVYKFVTDHFSLNSFQEMAGIVTVGVVYILVSQLMTALVFWLTEGKSLAESGLFDRILLIIELTQFAVGSLAALVWTINPYTIIFAISPLYLIHLTLQLPRIKLRAETDWKTGRYNACYFNNALEKELLRAERADQPLTVAMGDLDLLGNINNTYGHLAGDKAIIATANTIKKLVRKYDVVARFGGEEFSIIMPETTVERAIVRLEEIRVAIESTDIELSTNAVTFRVTMSFGIAGRECPGQKPGDIVHKADVALFQAKKYGRNQVYC